MTKTAIHYSGDTILIVYYLFSLHFIGKGQSVWDTYTHAGKAKNGDNGDISTDSYRLYLTDVHLLKDLNVCSCF